MNEQYCQGGTIYVKNVEERWILSFERDQPIHWEENDDDGTKDDLEESDFAQFDDWLLEPVLVLPFDVLIFELLRKEVLLIWLAHVVQNFFHIYLSFKFFCGWGRFHIFFWNLNVIQFTLVIFRIVVVQANFVNGQGATFSLT